ncbi:unnamed protein product, partial [Prorocentrum cordatum]
AKVEHDVILSYSAGISACEKGEQWQQGRAVAAGAGATERDVGGEAGARRHQLQRCDQRVREGRAVAAGACAAERDMGGERALALLSEM